MEQRSVLDTCAALEGFEVVEIPVDAHGSIDLAVLAGELETGACLVCVQFGNGEIGTLQPVEQISELTRSSKALFLADATYAAGWVPLDMRRSGADLVALSGIRCGGPPGTGLLWARSGVRLRPMLPGDDRERGARAGMQNTMALAGLAAGLEAWISDLQPRAERVSSLTSRIRMELPDLLDEVLIHGHAERRLPHIVSFSVPMVEGEALLLGLDREGFAVHSGSACSSSTGEPSHVLAAIGTLTHGAIRVSLGPETTQGDVDGFLQLLPRIVSDARATLGQR